MLRSFTISILAVCLSLTVSAQEDRESYSSEFIWGINKNTAGGLIGGFVFRKSRSIGDRLFESVGLELMNVKHPLESQFSVGSGSSFIFGKVNYLYALRFQYGRELILFRKAPQQGVEIKAVAAAGPSIGLLAPYYVEIGTNQTTSVREPYNPNDPDHIPGDIVGPGYIFQGVQDSKIRIGGNLKAGLSFELGSVKSSVTGFEIGALVDAYTQKIELMTGTENRSIFPTAYVTIFYGTRR